MASPNRYRSSLAWMLGLVLLAMGQVGCGPGRYNLTVSLDERLRDAGTGTWPSVQVDLVGVSEADYSRWSSMSVTEYFQPDSDLRLDAQDRTYTVRFDNRNPQPKMVHRSNAIWDKWLKQLKAEHLFVLANLPGAHRDAEGEVDPRRLILPLDRRRWRGDSIEIVLQRSGLVTATPMKPAK